METRRRVGRAMVGLGAAGFLLGVAAMPGAAAAAAGRAGRPHAARPAAVGSWLLASGRVDAVTDGAVIVSLRSGRVLALNLTPKAQVRDGLAPSSLAQVAAGDYVLAHYRVTAQGLVTSRLTFSTGPLATGRRRRVVGRVTATTSDQFTLALRDGKTLTVTDLPGTRFVAAGKPASPAALTAGVFVRALVRRGTGLADALAVDIAPAPVWLHRAALRGTLTAVAPTSLTLRAANGATESVAMLPDTAVELGGKPVAPAALAAGDRVAVLGVRFDRVFYALRVRAAPAATSSGSAGATGTTPAAG